MSSSTDPSTMKQKIVAGGGDDDKTSSSTSSLPRIDKVDRVASTKWLALDTMSYTDQEGTARKWDIATRTTKQDVNKADAVIIIPLLRHSGKGPIDTILVEQYRPPVRQRTMEFPAGLIDKDETPQDAALRELREETGYVGEKCSVPPQVSRQLCMSPGLTDESVHAVLVEVDLDNPYNHGTPQPALDPGEFVVMKRVSLQEGFKAVLDDSDKTKGMPIMGLYLFAMGLELGRQQQEHATTVVAAKKTDGGNNDSDVMGKKQRLT